LGCKILENREEHDNLAEQMRHVESVIKMLDSSYNLVRIAVKQRKGNPWFKRGMLWRKALDMLRKAPEAMTTAEIATAVLAAHGVEATKDDVQSVALGYPRQPQKPQGQGRGASWRVSTSALEPAPQQLEKSCHNGLKAGTMFPI
jgi:hypothetical protein